MPAVIISRKSGERYTHVSTDRPIDAFHVYADAKGFRINNVTRDDIGTHGQINKRFVEG